MHAVVVMTLCVLILHAPGVLAQDTPSAPVPDAPRTAESPPDPKIDASKLPVSIGRIRLRLSADPAVKPGLKIQQTIEVVGVAPPFELWSKAESAKLNSGPVPFGAPTQKDILDLTTPQEFKRYPMDLNALMLWLTEKLGEKRAE